MGANLKILKKWEGHDDFADFPEYHADFAHFQKDVVIAAYDF